MNFGFIKKKIRLRQQRHQIGVEFKMKVDLNRRELHLVRLWWLSCEDMMIPEGTCRQCELRDECEFVRKKLYGENGGSKIKEQLDFKESVENNQTEELVAT
jgi:hypothetical protein